MLRKLSFCILLLCAGASVAAAVELDRVVATINNDVVTSVQLEKAMAAPDRVGAGASQREVLDRLIEESLLRQRAAEIGLQVGDDEVEAAIKDVLQQNRLTREQLEEALRQQGVALEDYRKTLRKQILRYKLAARELQSRIEVSGREIKAYYEAHADDYREPATVGLQHLFFPVDAKASGEQRDALHQAALEARGALLGGASTEKTLADFAARGATGGDMGNLPLSGLTPAFAKAIADLPVGGSSEVVETEKGWHLLTVTARTPGKVRPLDEVSASIRERLAEEKKGSAGKLWMEELKKKAHIAILL